MLSHAFAASRGEMGYFASELGIAFAWHSLRQLKPPQANQISPSSSISVINSKETPHSGHLWGWAWGWATQGRLPRPRRGVAYAKCVTWALMTMPVTDTVPEAVYVDAIFMWPGLCAFRCCCGSHTRTRTRTLNTRSPECLRLITFQRLLCN